MNVKYNFKKLNISIMKVRNNKILCPCLDFENGSGGIEKGEEKLGQKKVYLNFI